jgi:hypothetical protein
MLFLEGWARPLLVVHAIAAAVLVGASTHHLVWCRGYLRKRFPAATVRAEQRFARIAAIAYVVTFLVGNLLYPTYKVRVRAEYLDAPSVVAAEVARRDAQRIAVTARPAPAPSEAAPRGLQWVARLFDVKEHWVALGTAAALALLALSRWSHPRQQPGALVVYLGLSLFVCATAWTGAVVGLVTASYRAVGRAG